MRNSVKIKNNVTNQKKTLVTNAISYKCFSLLYKSCLSLTMKTFGIATEGLLVLVFNQTKRLNEQYFCLKNCNHHQ